MAISNPSLAQIKQALTEMLPKLKPLSVPTGMISAFHTVPDGWLQCNGAAVSRTTYAALFAVIGTKYGSGDGSNTFNLPLLHHKFIEGTNTQSEVGQSVSAGLPNIRGTAKGFRSIFGDTETNWNEGGLSTSTEVPDAAGIDPVFGHTVGIARRDLQLSANASNDIFGHSTTVQPSALRLIPCIKF